MRKIIITTVIIGAFAIGLTAGLLVKPVLGGKIMNKKEITQELPQGFPQVVSTYTYYDRTLTLTDFSEFEIGARYGDVVKALGEPNGFWGSGVSWPYYQLNDGSCVTLYSLSDDSGEIFDIKITDIKGRTFELKK